LLFYSAALSLETLGVHAHRSKCWKRTWSEKGWQLLIEHVAHKSKNAYFLGAPLSTGIRSFNLTSKGKDVHVALYPATTHT